MAIDPEEFNQQFSALANALQRALGLAEQAAAQAALQGFAASELFEAIQAAAAAARALRPNGGAPKS